MGQEDVRETEGKGEQKRGQTSTVVWGRDLGNNEKTRSTASSKFDEDAEVDVRRQGAIIYEINTLEVQQECRKRPSKLQKIVSSGTAI